MAIVTLNGTAGLARWTALQQATPAGLTQKDLTLTSAIETTPVDPVREGAATAPAANPVLLTIPYRYLVSDHAYRRYLDGYTIPQMKGWIAAGILSRYTILMASYPAGRPWTAMLLLEYRDDAALAARDAVRDRVRAQLAGDPAWKAISDDKKSVRAELALTVAEDAEVPPPDSTGK